MDNQPKSSTISGFKFPIKIAPKSIIGTVVILLVVGGVGFWYWTQKENRTPDTQTVKTGSVPTTAELQENVGGGLGASIYEKSQNPIVDKLPETNPFGKAPINPLKSIYTNPFE